MDYYVRSMLNGTNQVRSPESVIYNQRNIMTMSDFCNSIDIRHIRIRIPKSFGINRFRIRSDCSLEQFQIIHIDDSIANTLCCQRMRNEIERTAI